jgi:hypothetical protein
VVAGVLAAASLLNPALAYADDTIKHPGDHPDYHVEIEPHVLFAYDGIFADSGFGLGGRFSIPIVKNGFVPSINNSVAIGFGVDWVHYSDNCHYRDRFGAYGCDANYFFFPVVMQWNFFVAQRWSVFGEPGLFIYTGSYDNNCPPNSPCDISRSGVRPAIYVGGRFHITDTLSLTMRLGWPTLSVGLSFFP